MAEEKIAKCVKDLMYIVARHAELEAWRDVLFRVFESINFYVLQYRLFRLLSEEKRKELKELVREYRRHEKRLNEALSRISSLIAEKENELRLQCMVEKLLQEEEG